MRRHNVVEKLRPVIVVPSQDPGSFAAGADPVDKTGRWRTSPPTLRKTRVPLREIRRGTTRRRYSEGLMTTIRSPPSTLVGWDSATRSTTPSLVAEMFASIFMASIVAIG